MMCRLFGLAFALSTLFVAATVEANATVEGTLFYTRFAGRPNVKSVDFDYDGTTFTLAAPVAIASSEPHADGIAGDPQNDDLLIIGADSAVNTVSKSTGTVTNFATPVRAFHLEVTDDTTVYAAGIPGGLARHDIMPDGSLTVGTMIPLAGDDTVITQLITTPAGFFYTSSAPNGDGNYGTLEFAPDGLSATTDRLYGAGGTIDTAVLNAAHGGIYDPFTGNVMIFGKDSMTQLDLTGTIVSDRNFIGVDGVNPDFDQGTVDGEGHAYVASTSGHLFFVDYAATGLIGDVGNFAAAPFLDTSLDDVAPLVGAGTTIPEPSTIALLCVVLVSLVATGRRS